MNLRKTNCIAVALLLAITLMVSSTLYAQPKGKEKGKYFNPDTITTLDIEIKEINGLADDSEKRNGTGKGMHYVVTSGSTSYYAIFAPPFWLDENDIELEVGTSLSVTGSVVDSWLEDFDEYQVIIVTELTLNGTTVKLRDAETGKPEWPAKKPVYKAPKWNPDTVDTVSSTVLKVKTRTRGKNKETGLQVVFRNEEDQRITAYVGPTFYLEEIGLSIAVDDDIVITGSFIRNKVVLVQKITVNGAEFTLRDEDGKPLWFVK